jgi:hypothetical protein
MTVFTLSCWLSILLVRHRLVATSCMIIAMGSSIFLVYYMIIALGELLI